MLEKLFQGNLKRVKVDLLPITSKVGNAVTILSMSSNADCLTMYTKNGPVVDKVTFKLYDMHTRNTLYMDSLYRPKMQVDVFDINIRTMDLRDYNISTVNDTTSGFLKSCGYSLSEVEIKLFLQKTIKKWYVNYSRIEYNSWLKLIESV